MIIVIEVNKNNKVEFTKKELEELLEQARQEGARECSKQTYIYTTPSSPSFVNPYQFTCVTIPTSKTEDTTTKLNGAPIINGI